MSNCSKTCKWGHKPSLTDPAFCPRQVSFPIPQRPLLSEPSERRPAGKRPTSSRPYEAVVHRWVCGAKQDM